LRRLESLSMLKKVGGYPDSERIICRSLVRRFAKGSFGEEPEPEWTRDNHCSATFITLRPADLVDPACDPSVEAMGAVEYITPPAKALRGLLRAIV